MELEAARFLNFLCRVVNPTTTEHLPSTSTPLTGKAVDELPTSQLTLTDLNTPLSNPNEVTLPPSEGDTDQESSASTTSSSAVISSSVPPSGTLVLNNSQTPGDSSSDLNVLAQDESTGVQTAYVMSWQLAVAWAMLIVLFVMIVLCVGYVIKKRRGRLECINLFGVKKKKKQRILAEAYGFPEVRLRSRSGELDLSDVRRSIEVGSYNVRSGTIAYGESFYM